MQIQHRVKGQTVCVWSYPGSECQMTWCVFVSCVCVLSWPADLSPGFGLDGLVPSETEWRFLKKWRLSKTARHQAGFHLVGKIIYPGLFETFYSYLLHMTRNILHTVSAHVLSHILSGLRGTYLSLQVWRLSRLWMLFPTHMPALLTNLKHIIQ